MNCFEQYLASTKDLHETQQGKSNILFISLVKPHRPVTRAIISRWILSLIKEAGIDTTIFKAHSVRGASTTAAANALVPFQKILDMANWSKAVTFRQFYYKPIFLHFWRDNTFVVSFTALLLCYNIIKLICDICICVVLKSTICCLVYFDWSSPHIIPIIRVLISLTV